MFDNIYLEKIAKNVGLKGELLPNKAEVMRQVIANEMADDIGEYQLNDPRKRAKYVPAPVLNRPVPTPVAPAVAPSVLPTRESAAVAKAAKGGMSLAAKLGIGGLAAAGLAGGAYYAMNDGHHSKRASAIEGLVLAGYSVEQALQILEG